MKRKSLWIVCVFLLVATTLGAGGKHVHLLPRLRPGQTFTYLIRFQSDKTVKTDSKVVAPMAPDATQLDAHGLLRVEILDVQGTPGNAIIRARGQFLTPDSGVAMKLPNDKNLAGSIPSVAPNGKSFEFTISPDGSVNTMKGLDSLSPEQQQAWQQWVARFALAWTLPTDGLKSGEKSRAVSCSRTTQPWQAMALPTMTATA